MMPSKTIYSIDKSTLGQSKVVPEDYQINSIFETEKEPPEKALILAWDIQTMSWYDAGSGVHEGLENQDQQLTDAMMAIAELYEQKLLLENRVAELEAIVLPK